MDITKTEKPHFHRCRVLDNAREHYEGKLGTQAKLYELAASLLLHSRNAFEDIALFFTFLHINHGTVDEVPDDIKIVAIPPTGKYAPALHIKRIDGRVSVGLTLVEALDEQSVILMA